MNTKEIHFYTNLCDIEQVSDWDLDTMLTDFVSTRDSIEKGETRIVKTTQLSFLRNTWDYIDRGIRVFVHNDGHEIEITEHCNACNKDLRVGHDVSRLFIGGAFGELK